MEFSLLKHLKLQPSELDKIEFYRIEYLIEHFKKYNEEEKKRQESEEKKQKKDYERGVDTKKYMKDFGGMPKMPKFKI